MYTLELLVFPLLTLGTRELLGNLQWSPCSVPGASVFTAVHQILNIWLASTTTGPVSGESFACLVIVSLLGFAVSADGLQENKSSKDCCSALGLRWLCHLFRTNILCICPFQYYREYLCGVSLSSFAVRLFTFQWCKPMARNYLHL